MVVNLMGVGGVSFIFVFFFFFSNCIVFYKLLLNFLMLFVDECGGFRIFWLFVDLFDMIIILGVDFNVGSRLVCWLFVCKI